jgi:magnesium transporter
MARRRTRDRKKFWKRRLAQTYVPPGTLTCNPYAQKSLIRIIAYGPDAFIEQTLTDVDQIAQFAGKWPVTWINVDGLGDMSVLQRLGEIYNLHKLALEDALNLDQRAKVEQYGQHLFIVARMASWLEKLETEQISIFLGDGVVITFQETYGDCLDPIRERIRKKGGRIRSVGADYLAYALLDAIVDAYFPILERYGERLEEIEDDVLDRPERGVVARIQATKRELLTLRRSMWPLREAVNHLMRESTPVITADTRIYLRDCYDHSVQILDLIETYRELESGLMEIYLSSVSYRLNEVMKVLTIISTIFIPLTFVTSLYGMNFKHMPELETWWAYPAVLLVMSVIALAMLMFFRRKGWLSVMDARRKALEASEQGDGVSPMEE